MNNPIKDQTKPPDKELLLAMVTHDLKNPVSSGILAVKLLQDKRFSPLNSYQKEIIDNVMVSLNYMQNLIENILDRYKVNNQVYSISKREIDFVYFVTSVIEEAKYIFSDKNQKVKIFSKIKTGLINLDILEIKRVINNLISNSSKYSPENSQIIIRLFEQGDCLGFSIENAGCNFDIKDSEKIFEKFVSLDKNNKSVASGLGLFIVRKIIEKHGGQIYVESEIGKFTRFVFILPRK